MTAIAALLFAVQAVSAAPAAVPGVAAPDWLTQPEVLLTWSEADAGHEVMAWVDRWDSGFGDLSVELTMRLRTRKGRESERSLRIAQLEMPDDGDRLLVLFDTPLAVRGTALLSYSHAAGEDDQWLYLPAFARTRKIAARNRSGPFLSSEFAFEDLVAQELEKFTYRYLGREPCGELSCLTVERTPLDRFSGYSRQVVRVHPQFLRIEAIDYYNRSGRLQKQLTQTGFERYQGRFWRPAEMLMVNLITGKSTILEWRNFRFATGLDPERDFSVASLSRQR